jgi:hypothetical protein
MEERDELLTVATLFSQVHRVPLYLALELMRDSGLRAEFLDVCRVRVKEGSRKSRDPA